MRMPDEVRNSVDVRLYEAFRKGVGIRLSIYDISDLINSDDAMLARISNKLSGDECQSNCLGNCTKTAAQLWKQFHASEPPTTNTNR